MVMVAFGAHDWRKFSLSVTWVWVSGKLSPHRTRNGGQDSRFSALVIALAEAVRLGKVYESGLLQLEAVLKVWSSGYARHIDYLSFSALTIFFGQHYKYGNKAEDFFSSQKHMCLWQIAARGIRFKICFRTSQCLAISITCGLRVRAVSGVSRLGGS